MESRPGANRVNRESIITLDFNVFVYFFSGQTYDVSGNDSGNGSCCGFSRKYIFLKWLLLALVIIAVIFCIIWFLVQAKTESSSLTKDSTKSNEHRQGKRLCFFMLFYHLFNLTCQPLFIKCNLSYRLSVFATHLDAI